MLVPAIAFSWWLASVPMAKASPSHVPTIATTSRTAVHAVAPDDTSSDDTSDDATTDTSGDVADDTAKRTLYRGLITPAIAQQARGFLDLPMGAERTADVEGHHFVFVLERHYHPPGFVGAPTGWHKGVTVYEAL
jgi:hypothetical protein